MNKNYLKPDLMRFSLITILLSALLFNSCDWINPEEKIPAYIRIDEFKLATNVNFQGPNNHKITDAWVYVNGEFIGLFEMPFEIPVLITGEVTIHVKPGIKNNGIAASRIHYPFYQIWQIDTVLNEMQTMLLKPSTSYYPETNFSWLERFEDPGVTIDTTYLGNVALTTMQANGSRVGSIVLNSNSEIFDAETISYFEPPTSIYTTYLEMDYFCNQEFTVGLYLGIPGSLIIQPLIYMNPVESWNKIYIDLSYYMQTTQNLEDFQLYFRAVKDTTIEQGIIQLDNLKLLHF
jgi:hypothetical protein